MQNADCNAVGIKGLTLLHEAVRYDPGKDVKLFLAVPNVDFNTAYTDGRASLHCIFELLVEVPNVHVNTAYLNDSTPRQ